MRTSLRCKPRASLRTVDACCGTNGLHHFPSTSPLRYHPCSVLPSCPSLHRAGRPGHQVPGACGGPQDAALRQDRLRRGAGEAAGACVLWCVCACVDGAWGSSRSRRCEGHTDAVFCDQQKLCWVEWKHRLMRRAAVRRNSSVGCYSRRCGFVAADTCTVCASALFPAAKTKLFTPRFRDA
jgi:hypothetical protein